MNSKYEAVIGLECHCQLLTNSKLFCSCSTSFGESPNMNTCPVCLGLPGALPVLNRVAVTMAVKAGLGLNCTINPESQWSRKNYFYPDLPKGYQISQYDRPICEHGFIEISESTAHPGRRSAFSGFTWKKMPASRSTKVFRIPTETPISISIAAAFRWSKS